LALAGPSLEERQELFDFVEELRIREALCPHRMRPVRTALENQRMTWLALVLDEYLANIAQCFQAPLELVRRLSAATKKPSSTAYWTR